MDAEIIAVGTELLMGETIDTNSGWLASRLPTVGLPLRWVTVVGDDLDLLVEALERAMRRSTVTFTMGGLGPTEDDLTRESIARALGEEIRIDPRVLRDLEAYFARRGVEMPPRNRKQAGITPSAQFLPNPHGTAPGWWVERDGRIIVAMPGPPSELQYMWEYQVKPRLRERSMGSIILSRTFKTLGLTEGEVDDLVSEFHGRENPTLGTYAKPDGIHVRLIARGAGEEEAREVIRPVEARIRTVLGNYIWGVDDEQAEERAVQLLRERGLTLAIMESCSGGLLASAISEAPASAELFKGGIVASTKEAKAACGVEPQLMERHGVVSQEAAVAMAQAARQRLGADIGIGVAGVAGPEDQDGAEAGTIYIAIAHEGGVSHEHHRVPPRPALIRRRAVVVSLLLLNRVLRELL